MSSRPVLVLLTVTFVLVAGCASTSSESTTPTAKTTEIDTTTHATETTTMQPTRTTQTTRTTTATESPCSRAQVGVSGPRNYSSPPQNLSAESVKRAALEYEAAYVYNYLAQYDRLENIGLSSSTADKRATIRNRSRGGVFVRVTHPYSYEYSNGAVDDSTYATYFVTTGSICRVDGSRITVA